MTSSFNWTSTFGSSQDPGIERRDRETLEREKELQRLIEAEKEEEQILTDNAERIRQKDLEENPPLENLESRNLETKPEHWLLKGLGWVGDRMDDVDRAAGFGEYNIYNARQNVIRPLSETHVALGILGELLLPDTFDIATFGLGYIPKRFAKLPKTWAKLTKAMNGAKARNIVNSGDVLVDAGSGARITEDIIDGSVMMAKTTNTSSAARRAWKSKRTIQGFDDALIQTIDSAAWDYRRTRNRLGKKQVMKGYIFPNGERTIKNSAGQEFTMVRKSRRIHPDPLHPDNYQFKSIWEINENLATRSGWTKGVKEMDDLKKELNKFRMNHPDQYYHTLMEYGDLAYLEHKVAKKQPWFWNLKKRNSNFATWAAPGRNTEENIRLLFNDSFKRLKDQTEVFVKRINKTGIRRGDDTKKLVIDIEDPMSGNWAKRSNPGNLLVREADSGEVVGILGDYLQEFYTKKFSKSFNQSKFKKILKGDDIPDFYKIKEVSTRGKGKVRLETLEEYRDRILNDRLQLINVNAGNYTQIGMTGYVNRDLVDFYELFDRKLGWIETPTYISKQLDWDRAQDIATAGAIRRTSKVPHHTDAWNKRLELEKLRREGK